jgi:hypothetical protein
MNRKHKHAFRHRILPQSDTAQFATLAFAGLRHFRNTPDLNVSIGIVLR